MTFAEMVTSSVLARALALFILAITMVAAVIVGVYDLLIGRSVPPEVVTIVGGGIGFAFALIGVNFGVVLQPMATKKTPASVTTITTTTGPLPVPPQNGNVPSSIP